MGNEGLLPIGFAWGLARSQRAVVSPADVLLTGLVPVTRGRGILVMPLSPCEYVTVIGV